MAYYIRVLSPLETPVSLEVLRQAAGADVVVDADVSADSQEGNWRQLVIGYADGTEVCIVERDGLDGDLVADEVDEFLQEIESCEPQSAAGWLASYLPRVTTIYAIQILNAVYERPNGWEIVRAVQGAIWNAAGGIIQADGEGFSNEDGYHILWQFSDNVTGSWWMAVLDGDAWVNFEMDLGDPDQRASFRRGDVPSKLTQID